MVGKLTWSPAWNWRRWREQKGRDELREELRDQKRFWAVPVKTGSGLHKCRMSVPIRSTLKNFEELAIFEVPKQGRGG